MHIQQSDIAASFMVGPLLFVVARNGTVYRFDGYNNWSQVAYLPVNA